MESGGENTKQFVSLDLPETMPTSSSNQLDFLPTNYDYSTSPSGSTKPGESSDAGMNYSNQTGFSMGFIGKIGL